MPSNDLVKKAMTLLKKRGFVPMPGGQPPMDPAAAGMDPAMAGAPMDPAMAGAPMDPSMAGAAGGGQMPMSVMELPVEEFYAMLVSAFSEAMAAAGAQQPAVATAPAPQPAQESEGGGEGSSNGNEEIVQKLDKVIELLSSDQQSAQPAQQGLPPLVPGAAPAGAPGFVGAGGMTAQAQVEEIPEKVASPLVDMILSSVKKASK